MTSTGVTVIVAGSRRVQIRAAVYKAIEHFQSECPLPVKGIISGMARGVDTHGKHYGHENNIPVCYHPARWEVFGKRAGHIRNTDMAKHGDALVLVTMAGEFTPEHSPRVMVYVLQGQGPRTRHLQVRSVHQSQLRTLR